MKTLIVALIILSVNYVMLAREAIRLEKENSQITRSFCPSWRVYYFDGELPHCWPRQIVERRKKNENFLNENFLVELLK